MQLALEQIQVVGVVQVVDAVVAQALGSREPEHVGDSRLVAAVPARQAGDVHDHDDVPPAVAHVGHEPHHLGAIAYGRARHDLLVGLVDAPSAVGGHRLRDAHVARERLLKALALAVVARLAQVAAHARVNLHVFHGIVVTSFILSRCWIGAAELW